jgi:serine/threonine protein kinase
MDADTREYAEDANSEALAPGSLLLSGQYEILEYLSSGGFGITYLARDSLNRRVVIKECFPEAFCSRVNRTVRPRTRNYQSDFRSVVQLFIREAHSLSRLDHANVVGVHQVFEDNETAYMALDLIDGKDLLEIIETREPALAPGQITRMTLDLLDAIAHVHGQDLLHRDISPDNILVDRNGRPVLIDFGAAREEASRKSRVLSAVLVVKDGYSPQEFYVAGSQQFPCSDLYAFAATLSHLISEEAPPNSQARLAALAAGQPDLYQPLLGRFPDYDDDFLAAIDKAMNIIPAKRIQSAEDWILMIDHRKRAELARARARDDKSIDLTVMNLVKSVNFDLETQTTLTAPVSVPRAPAPEARPAPVIAVDAPAKPVSVNNEMVVKEDLSEVYEVEIEEVPEPARLTPYARIKAASESAKAPPAEEPPPVVEQKSRTSALCRWATVPVIFLAYFFYASTALQFEAVRAATVTPLVMIGEETGLWAAIRMIGEG